eukprot:scaffold12094_cov140-Skeletonema_marinoi.AAC.4
MAPPLRAATLGFGFSTLFIVLLEAVIIASSIAVLGVFDFARLMMQPSSPNFKSKTACISAQAF